MAGHGQDNIENQFSSICQDLSLHLAQRNDGNATDVPSPRPRRYRNAICATCRLDIYGIACLQDGTPRHFGCLDLSHDYTEQVWTSDGSQSLKNTKQEVLGLRTAIVEATQACTGEGQQCRVPRLVVLSALAFVSLAISASYNSGLFDEKPSAVTMHQLVHILKILYCLSILLPPCELVAVAHGLLCLCGPAAVVIAKRLSHLPAGDFQRHVCISIWPRTQQLVFYAWP